ncbi:MAG TPA: flagellar basal body rod protein FlgC [Verrucomicrobiae bacterium]|nr:flagellar basal body rod protein FlgC [Verrucomicrobiae bacterium]
MIDFLPGVESTTAALSAERIRMDVISQNIANANTTQGPDGKPYQRQEVVFEDVLNQQVGDPTNAQPQPVRVARIQSDDRPPQMVYSPGNPNADKNGMVAMPNINIHEEMADLISSSRAFEANLAVIKNAHAMALQTLSIGRRA